MYIITHLRHYPWLIILFILMLHYPEADSQQACSYDSTRIRILTVARDIIYDTRLCALITLDEEGSPRVRTMDPFLPDSNFVIWFGTNPESRKAGQIKNDTRVTLYYAAPDESGYVTISGRALLVNDPSEKKQHWKKEWTAFYPDMPDGYLLIKVVPVWMEVLSFTHGLPGDPVTWQPPRITFGKQE